MQIQCILPLELNALILGFCENRELDKTACVCKAWQKICNELHLDRQIKSLPESLQKICGKGFTINNNLYSNLSLTVELRKAVLKLNSLCICSGEFEDYTLTLNEGSPRSLHLHNLRTNGLTSIHAMNLFFKTIVGRLSDAKFQNGNIEISGLYEYLARYRLEII